MSMLRRESRRANTWRSKSMERRISKRSRSSSSTERERSRSKERGRHKSMKRQRNKRRRRSSSTERERSSSKEREIHKSRKRQRNKRRRRSSSTGRESSRSKERGRHKSTKRQRNKRRRRSKDGKKSNEMGKKRRSREGMKKSRSSTSSDSRNRSRSKESSSSPMDQISSDEDLSCEPKFYKHQCMVFTVNRVRMSETFKYILKNIGALTARGKKSRIVFLRGSHGSETGDDGLRNKELIDEQLYTQFCELLGLHRKSRTFQNITKVSHTKELEWRTRQIKADVTDIAKVNNDKTKTKKQKDCLKESIRKNGELFLKEGIPAVK